MEMQVEGTKYVFESKTIQRMELLVLSGLQWRMNPVTPVSFLDHIIRRLGLKSYVHWEFLTSCENLLLSLVSGNLFIFLFFHFQDSIFNTSRQRTNIFKRKKRKEKRLNL